MSRTARLLAAAGLTALLSGTAAVAVTTGTSGVGWDSVQAATAPGGVGWDSVRAAGPQGLGWDSAATGKSGIAWD
ncbi:hypothetical protein [Streptomyces lavendulae]|uniref:hypothetical protein n=1 Tax=Streptomyces lavendulae TaxID=1914 RepID=UPI0024A33C53|nr:hypothetical protein [Streptomyces lavendulae]GLX18653.1 hypothetical protein Slala01_22970 [Streptomyces lavendulae subsp. lavendulae]GLX30414.1 hypothetical protein Slala02_62340 [Streptomyces lavendulae subsp. lavendulae]